MLTVLDQKDFQKIFTIMQNSFPIDEYRPLEEQKALLNREDYLLYVYKNSADIQAFFAVWDLGYFAFIEHFAVKEEYRSAGIGTKLLQNLLIQLAKPVILEVELPETLLAKKRIAFYEKNGFLVNNYAYMQPAIAKGRKEIPLILMSYPGALNTVEYIAVKNSLYAQVYGKV